MTEEKKADISINIEICSDTHDVDVFANINMNDSQLIGLLDMVATIIDEATDAEPLIIEDMEDIKNYILDAPKEESEGKPKLRRVK